MAILRWRFCGPLVPELTVNLAIGCSSCLPGHLLVHHAGGCQAQQASVQHLPNWHLSSIPLFVVRVPANRFLQPVCTTDFHGAWLVRSVPRVLSVGGVIAARESDHAVRFVIRSLDVHIPGMNALPAGTLDASCCISLYAFRNEYCSTRASQAGLAQWLLVLSLEQSFGVQELGLSVSASRSI